MAEQRQKRQTAPKGWMARIDLGGRALDAYAAVQTAEPSRTCCGSPMTEGWTRACPSPADRAQPLHRQQLPSHLGQNSIPADLELTRGIVGFDGDENGCCGSRFGDYLGSVG